MPRKRRGFWRSLLWVLTVIYGVSLLLLIGALEWWGEYHWLLSLLLFAPPQFLFAPLVVLFPLGLLSDRRLCLWHLLCAFVIGFGYITFRWAPSIRATDATLTVVTFNCGESDRDGFFAFADAEKPDVILLQDAVHRGAMWAPHFPGRFAAVVGEFCAISKYPIKSASVVADPTGGPDPLAGRFEIQRGRRTLVLYSVHLPTPRRELRRFVTRHIVGELAKVDERAAVVESHQDWVRWRIRRARELAAVFEGERLPFIVAGDFNTPDHGYIYHVFAGKLTDAFAACGRGWGLTFPGDTGNRLKLFGPFLRLDFFFVGSGWRAIECRPEIEHKSQHRAVLARFNPVESAR